MCRRPRWINRTCESFEFWCESGPRKIAAGWGAQAAFPSPPRSPRESRLPERWSRTTELGGGHESSLRQSRSARRIRSRRAPWLPRIDCVRGRPLFHRVHQHSLRRLQMPVRQWRAGCDLHRQRQRAAELRAAAVSGGRWKRVDGTESAGVGAGRERLGLRPAAGAGSGFGEIRVAGAVSLVCSCP